MIRNESEILNVGMSKPPNMASRPVGGLRLSGGTGRCPGAKKRVSKMKKKYYLKLKDNFMLITRCCVPRTF